MRITLELGRMAPSVATSARLLVADASGQRCLKALPSPIIANASRLTLGFAAPRAPTALALRIGGRSLPLDGAAGDVVVSATAELLQLAALRCVSQQLRATRERLDGALAFGALLRIERDDARRAATRAGAAAHDATALAERASAPTHDRTARGGGPLARPTRPALTRLRRRVPVRATMAAAAVSSTALALTILGWPTRDGEHESGIAGVAAASPAKVTPSAIGSGRMPATAGVLARRLGIPVDYLELYRGAAARYGLDWTRLAAIGAIESTHGQGVAAGVTSGSNPRGASGPAQFLIGTWERFGVDGNANGLRDPHDPADAIPSMASYLRASGAPQDWPAALRSYNHSDAYVAAVEQLAASYRSSSRAPVRE